MGRAGDIAQLVQHLPGKCKMLSSIPGAKTQNKTEMTGQQLGLLMNSSRYLRKAFMTIFFQRTDSDFLIHSVGLMLSNVSLSGQ